MQFSGPQPRASLGRQISAFQSEKPRKGIQNLNNPEGSTDLRQLLNQIEALQLQLSRYRPAIAAQLAALADGA